MRKFKAYILISALMLSQSVIAEESVSRGFLVKEVIDRFYLRERKEEQIEQCMDEIEFCLFNFSTASLYEEMSFEPLNLYPDVQEDSEFYEEINLATLLGIVNGHSSTEHSPFMPENSVTRAEALKIVLGANDLVYNKYRFEMVMELGSEESLFKQFVSFLDVRKEDWWQPRYINFALEKGIIDEGELFRPNVEITGQELDDMIDRTKEYIENEKIYSRGDTDIETFSGGSETDG